METTTREDVNAPPPPKAAIGKLPKCERPAQKEKNELYKYVAGWAGWSMRQKNSGTENFRYLVREMSEIEQMLESSEKTLKDFASQRQSWQQRVAKEGPVAVYDTMGSKMETRLKDLGGEVGPKHLGKVYPPLGGAIGKVNEAVLAMQVWISEEMLILSGNQIIQDRLIFAATNLAPLLSLRGRWVFELSAARKVVNEWRRAHEKEKNAARVEQAEKSQQQLKKQRTADKSLPAQSVPAERCLAIKKWAGQADVPDSIALKENEIIFRVRDHKGNLWSTVRRESDGVEGVVPTKRVRAAPLPPSPPPLGEDDEEEDSVQVAPAVSSDEEVDVALGGENTEDGEAAVGDIGGVQTGVVHGDAIDVALAEAMAQ